MGQTDQRAASSDDEIDLRELVGVLIVGRWKIIFGLLAGIFLGLFIAVTAPPTYRAAAVLELEDRSGASLALPSEMSDLLGSSDSRVLTEVEIIRSRLVLGQVVDEMGLDIAAAPRELPVVAYALRSFSLPDPGFGFLRAFAWSEEAIKVGQFEVPREWVGQEMTLTSHGDGSYSIALPDGSERVGKLREMLADPVLGLALRVDELTGAEGRQFLLTKLESEAAVNALRKRLTVAETGRQSSVLSLQLDGANRGFVTDTLNAILRAYLGQNVARGSAEAARSLDFINEQLPQSQKAVTDAQSALNDYRQQQQSVDLTYETQSLLNRVTEIEQKLAELALQEEEYKQKFTVNHPTYQALLQNRATLNEQLADLKKESGGLPETQKEVFNLTRDLEVAQNVYLALLSRQQELQVVKASVVGNVRVLDEGFADSVPIAPRKTLILSVSALAGLIVGAGAVFLQRAFHSGVRGAEDLERIGLPVFATVGLSEAIVHDPKRAQLPILAVEHPTDLVIEALRSLRTSLHFGLLDAKTRSILITSAAPEAGKSFTSVNLAVVAAEAGQRICLIDADMRRGFLRKYFGLDRNARGLADYLAGDVPLSEAIHNTKIDGLHVIPTGPLPPNPSELVMRKAFADMLEKLDQEYDLVLIDAPPTLAVTDPVIMGRSAGASIMVVRYDTTAIGEVEAVQRTFETAGGRIAGAILNGVKAESMTYGNKYYYYNKRYAYDSRK